MRRTSKGDIEFAPKDILTFVEDKFAAWMDRYDLEFPGEYSKDEPDEAKLLLFEKGMKHELACLEQLEAIYGEAVSIKEIHPKNKIEATINAMKSGSPLIYQGKLRKDNVSGDPDFLIKVPGDSKLGSYHYEVWDSKNTSEAQPKNALQLCAYSEMLADIQGVLPKQIVILLKEGAPVAYRLTDYFYYYLSAKNAFATFQESWSKGHRPIPHKDRKSSQWTNEALAYLKQVDHLSQIANINEVQIKVLEAYGITTMKRLASASPQECPTKMAEEVFNRLRKQARLQVVSEGKSRPIYEVLKHDPSVRKGLTLLPAQSKLDIYFDLEGYPFVEGGLEYLFGAVTFDHGKLEFHDWWAHDSQAEKIAFQHLIDWAYDRWQRDREMHIYHYGDYEISAMKRLASRYGTREFEVDELLRNHVFVNLYNVVRNGICVGEPKYSIKNLEKIYGQIRDSEVKAGGDSVAEYGRWIDEQDGIDYRSSKILKSLRDYNEADCQSTKALTDWLRSEQYKSNVPYLDPFASLEAPPESMGRTEGDVLAEELRKKIPSKGAVSSDHKLTGLLSNLIGFHQREDKPFWWSYFDRLQTKSESELLNDPECIAFARRVAGPTPDRQSVIYDYEFDIDQETKIERGSECIFFHNPHLKGKVTFIDTKLGKLSVRFGPQKAALAADAPQMVTLIAHKFVPSSTIAERIFEMGELLIDKAPSAVVPKHLQKFLLRQSPSTPIRKAGEPLILDPLRIVSETCEIALTMENSTLCIQGPPGAGKTYTASQMIATLLKAGKRIAVVCTSHKAVDNLLIAAARVCEAQDVLVDGWKIEPEPNEAFLEQTGLQNSPNGKSFFTDVDTYNLVGGTTWAFCRKEADGAFDYLIVDEAGQFSVANLVAISKCAQNLVLLGDQMQLEQPIKGTHPGDAGLSCLSYFLKDEETGLISSTVDPKVGIFLDETRRLHPEVCSFISEAVYEGKLKPHKDNHRKFLLPSEEGRTHISREAGLLFVPVAHEGNSNSSDEEVEKIRALTTELMSCGLTEAAGKTRNLELKDILFIAPYNVQRVKLQAALGPTARVGTVDLFQGQEAPVVILSMCSSSVENSSRGVNFLFSKNRINVAISRAKCLAIVVGNPDLQVTRVSSMRQLTLVNLFCRITHDGAPIKYMMAAK